MTTQEIFSKEFELNMDNQIDTSKDQIFSIFYSPIEGLVLGGLYIKFNIKKKEVKR